MFLKKDTEDVSVETKMLITFLFALAQKAGVSPKELAKAVVDERQSEKFMVEFTKEFLNSTIDSIAKKNKASKEK